MRKVLIVGAGQAGLQLALSLQAHGGYEVTVMSARTPDEIWRGGPTSTQCMFAPALEIERSHNLNWWEDPCPKLTAQRYNLAMPPEGGPDGTTPYTRAIQFTGRWKHPTTPEAPYYTQSVDQRIKMSGWLSGFEDRAEKLGGQVYYQGVATSDLDGLAALGRYDLIVIAAGKGELTALFDRDPERSPYSSPQRMLSAVYTHGMAFARDYQDYAVSFANIAGVGEFFRMPGLTVSGASGTQPCDILLFEGFPEGPLGPDTWEDLRRNPNPEEHLARTAHFMRQYVPWEYECLTDDFGVTDARPSLIGRYTPTVRRPVGQLPSGGQVLGMGDVLVANDPVTGQGSNNAAHCAEIYYQRIIEHGEAPFGEDWMQATFDAYWDYAGPVTQFTNAMLAQEPPEHVGRILAAGQHLDQTGESVIAERIAYGYTVPAQLSWMLDPDVTNSYLAQVAPDFASPAPTGS